MINSFWNICSTCPMPREEKEYYAFKIESLKPPELMKFGGNLSLNRQRWLQSFKICEVAHGLHNKEEKLNSEYKRNYVWHPQYKPLAQEVISCAPQPASKDVAMQRRKQYPDLAYRSNEVIQHDGGHHTKDATDLRARSEERDFGTTSKSGPRSRSAEPGMNHNQQKLIMIQSFPPISSGRVSVLPKTDEFPNITEPSCETTEYKSQFAWPRKPQTDVPCMARKSVSMGVIKGSEETDASVPKSKLAPIRRPCVKQKEVKNLEKTVQEVKKKVKTEYKAKYKPFTSYVYVDGQWKKTSRLLKVPKKEVETNEEPWFVEVVERLQKANEYRWRGHGHPVYGELLPDIYKQPPDRAASHSKVIPPELQINQPKCHLLPSKKTDSKKKEVHHDAVPERKREKDAKTAPLLKRPKSAEPAKVKEPIKHKRPATTPPAKSTTRALPSKKRLSKDEDILKPVKAKPPPPLSSAVSKKTREDTVKSSSSNKKTPFPSSQSSGGKVWLQAGRPASEPKGDDSSFREHSDAVRPSSLSPISAPSVPASEPSQKEYNNVEAESDKKQSSDETKSATPHSSVVPLTHVRTPEEVTGVKSPDPENWTVPIESSERLEWSGVNTPETSENIKPQEGISEKLSKLSVNDESVPSVMPSEVTATTAPCSSKSTPANVLDRARSRLDQFWGKNK